MLYLQVYVCIVHTVYENALLFFLLRPQREGAFLGPRGRDLSEAPGGRASNSLAQFVGAQQWRGERYDGTSSRTGPLRPKN